MAGSSPESGVWLGKAEGKVHWLPSPSGTLSPPTTSSAPPAPLGDTSYQGEQGWPWHGHAGACFPAGMAGTLPMELRAKEKSMDCLYQGHD